MKRYSLLVIAIFCIILNSCKPSSDKAQNYYSDILKQLDLIVEKESVMIQFINMEMQKTDTNFTSKSKIKIQDTTNLVLEIDASYLDFKNQIDKSLVELEKVSDFNGKSELKNAAIDLCKEYKSVVADEYIAVIKIVKIPLSLYTEDDDNKFLEFTETIDNKLQEKIDVYVKILKNFASEYKFELQGDSTKTINK
jgi:hypothetical protein